jgi:hypothetical protein
MPLKQQATESSVTPAGHIILILDSYSVMLCGVEWWSIKYRLQNDLFSKKGVQKLVNWHSTTNLLTTTILLFPFSITWFIWWLNLQLSVFHNVMRFSVFDRLFKDEEPRTSNFLLGTGISKEMVGWIRFANALLLGFFFTRNEHYTVYLGHNSEQVSLFYKILQQNLFILQPES